jgi:glyoxylase-like metal-dependent hydrolase (beta-lactamase superfamily II)
VGRCDFPGGSCEKLYDSVWGKIYAFPDEYEIYVGHDYQPGGRPLRYRTTVGAQKAGNIHLRESTAKADFVRFREGRDKTLSAPRLLNPSLDWNLGAHQIVKQTGL